MKKQTVEDIRKEIISTEKDKVIIVHQIKRLENRANYYTKAEKRKRTHHLCNIGGAIEALFPISKTLSKTEFFEFMEKISALPDVVSLVKETENRIMINTADDHGKDVV
ncbi:MAG: DUF3847 domain-containing protein [Clostridiales bacterium]|nr:DUF3847 domain-containing protein [Clostridiales bacterium]MBR3056649.1 DUF3847 domain-containing protein [Clostridiales bacterium]